MVRRGRARALDAHKILTTVSMRSSVPPRLRKQLRVTLVGVGQERRSALVTLTRTSSGTTTRWSASTFVEQSGTAIEHASRGHLDERAALVEAAEWLRRRFGARTTCLGGTVTIVGVWPSAAA